MLSAMAQSFSITSCTLTNGALQIAFPGQADSYYLLQAAPSLSVTSQPVSALLGSSGSLRFGHSVSQARAMFFRVAQLPLSATNDIIGDGIADGWKLQNGLDPFGPSVANQVPFGDTRTWLQIYQAVAGLPLAYFPVSSTTVVAGASNATLQVAFSQPFTGTLTYHLSGTAIPYKSGIGDYLPPPGYINVSSTTTANISINLTPSPAVEVNRTLLVALSAPSSNPAYTISTNSVAAIHILQSTQGVFLGTLSITNGLFLGAQSVKMALRPGAGSSMVAFFDTTPSPLLGNTFSVPVLSSASGFQLNGHGYTNELSNAPWGRNVTMSLVFGATQTNGTVFVTPVTLAATGLTASGQVYAGYGNLTLSRSQ